ncbi:LPS export ABC transporter periplasmic protein LptC [Xylophilus rhododendri]|uniref:LPS export ABC transporter periplasmic protein LptC n=1 Tax=Xylophilus rhododendri TaxID=2697032 RepID=A0A857JC50_9BURK|nr:LPS export ABC transporter periplasmic protein LptC [Xylophilus rhododendri]QHJ01527.1 LPS export ABC transporter periplasmic protein LptC [Xylophilus rhododendri]
MALLRGVLDRLSIYLPILLMSLLALGSYYLVRNAPSVQAPEVVRPPRHDADYFMRDFAVRTFDETGRLQREIFGVEGRHYPDTDTLEIDKPRIRAISETGAITVATAERGLSNGDGSEVQLIGNAVVTREPTTGRSGQALPRMQFRGEFLHAYTNIERVRSDRPVILTRGDDVFTGDAMDYDNLQQVMVLRGRVHGTLQPRQGAAAR